MGVSSITIPERRIPVYCEADVVVAGAGAAGIAAAVAAARSGAKVVLLEHYNSPGGMTTSGLLPSIIHMTDGPNMLSGGICKEIVDELVRRSGRPLNYNWQNIDHEVLKRVFDDLLAASGVTVLYQSHIYDCTVADGTLQAVAASAPGGNIAVTGKIFIDGTGDGNLSVLGGADFDCAADQMAPTLCTLFDSVDFSQIPENRRNAGQGRAEWSRLMEEGRAPLPEGHFVGAFRAGENRACGNLGHIYETDVLSPTSFSRACVEGRRLAAIYLDFFRKEVPGFQNATLAATAAQLGIRESRRIIGEYVLTADDYQARRRFADDIGCFAYPVDRHSGVADVQKQQNVEKHLAARRYELGEHYGIPYRALLPCKTRNLLVAGRCISCDRDMQSSVRVVPGCMITGQAAGTAAALSLEKNCSLRDIPVSELQARIRAGGNMI